jgi:hypothetical protein
MKLHREVAVFEMFHQGPVPIKMSLDEIINGGGATNSYHIFVLGKLSEFFKNGLKSASLQLENPIDFESGATSTAVVDGLKGMSGEDQVRLAQYLKDCIDAGESALFDKQSNVVDWIKFVLHAQK